MQAVTAVLSCSRGAVGGNRMSLLAVFKTAAIPQCPAILRKYSDASPLPSRAPSIVLVICATFFVVGVAHAEPGPCNQEIMDVTKNWPQARRALVQPPSTLPSLRQRIGIPAPPGSARTRKTRPPPRRRWNVGSAPNPTPAKPSSTRIASMSKARSRVHERGDECQAAGGL